VIATHGVALDVAVAHVRTALPPHAVLVGQNIAKDVQWLGLQVRPSPRSLPAVARHVIGWHSTQKRGLTTG
jgi:hypothetical protein